MRKLRLDDEEVAPESEVCPFCGAPRKEHDPQVTIVEGERMACIALLKSKTAHATKTSDEWRGKFEALSKVQKHQAAQFERRLEKTSDELAIAKSSEKNALHKADEAEKSADTAKRQVKKIEAEVKRLTGELERLAKADALVLEKSMKGVEAMARDDRMPPLRATKDELREYCQAFLFLAQTWKSRCEARHGKLGELEDLRKENAELSEEMSLLEDKLDYFMRLTQDMFGEAVLRGAHWNSMCL